METTEQKLLLLVYKLQGCMETLTKLVKNCGKVHYAPSTIQCQGCMYQGVCKELVWIEDKTREVNREIVGR
jgi:predicted enzyme related to lactoylglutathione lyase